MGDDEEFSLVVEDDEEALNYYWDKDYVFHDAMFMASKMAQAMADYFEVLTARMAADSNYRITQEDMAEKAALEIETLTTEQTEG